MGSPLSLFTANGCGPQGAGAARAALPRRTVSALVPLVERSTLALWQATMTHGGVSVSRPHPGGRRDAMIPRARLISNFIPYGSSRSRDRSQRAANRKKSEEPQTIFQWMCAPAARSGRRAAQRCPRAALALGRPCFSLAELAQSGTCAFKAKAEHRCVRAPPPSTGGALTRRWIDTPSARVSLRLRAGCGRHMRGPRAVGVSIPRLYLGAPETNCYSMCR
jgi:hypothetical protein